MNNKDYIRNKYAAEGMADSIRDYWRKKGYVGVKTWVEEERRITPLGSKLPSNYSVRSNIVFKVDSLLKELDAVE